MTATLHALGCGRAAGAYYTEDPNRQARPKSRDDYYTRDGNGTWWSSGSSLVRAGRRSTKTRSAIFARDLIREPAKHWCAALASGIAPGGTSHSQHLKVLEFSGPPVLPNNGLYWNVIQQDAVDQALELLVDGAPHQVRLGAGGHRREVPDDILVAKFPHFTSREGDPACHTHCVL